MKKIIRTSYFNSPKVNSIIEEGKEKYLISIARFTPNWFPDIKEEKLLAPSENLLRNYKLGKVTIKEYIKEYTTQIEPILDNIIIDNGSILLCYEKSGDFCHRHILAELLRNKGYEIKEL